jgi:phage terminase large subunit-like protein
MPVERSFLPRLETTGIGSLSFGPLVAAWAKRHMRVELMDWQVRALSGQLAHDDDGVLLHREALISTARQQGKSVALRALIGWWLTEFASMRGAAQNVLSIANRLDRAESIYNDLAPILKEHFDAKLLQAIGRKSATLPNGSRWEVRAASPRLHGSSNDLVVIDELFDVDEAVLDEALRPSMIARKSPLLSCWSTAGDASSVAMIKMREEAISLIDSGQRGLLYFAEWSMPPGKSGEEYWHYANPALGTTVTIEALRAASTKDYFLRAHLNQWVAARGAWLDNAAAWDLCKTSETMPPGGVLAVDSSIDESRYVGVRAAQLPDGRTIVHPEFVVDSELAMWENVHRVMAAPSTILLITPGLEIHLPPELRRRTTLTGYAELLKHTGLVRQMIVQGRLVHTGETSLAEHVARAVLVKTAQGAVVSSQKSPGPIELCRCMIWAAAVASKPETKQRPVLVVA